MLSRSNRTVCNPRRFTVNPRGVTVNLVLRVGIGLSLGREVSRGVFTELRYVALQPLHLIITVVRGGLARLASKRQASKRASGNWQHNFEKTKTCRWASIALYQTLVAQTATGIVPFHPGMQVFRRPRGPVRAASAWTRPGPKWTETAQNHEERSLTAPGPALPGVWCRRPWTGFTQATCGLPFCHVLSALHP